MDTIKPPPPGATAEEQRRYKRFLRLRNAEREIAAWRKMGADQNPRYQAKIASREAALANTEAYLNGEIEF